MKFEEDEVLDKDAETERDMDFDGGSGDAIVDDDVLLDDDLLLDEELTESEEDDEEMSDLLSDHI